MSLRRSFRRLVGAISFRKSSDLDSELEFHIQMRARDLEREGFSPKEALRLARIRVGNPTTLQEEIYEMDGIRFLDNLARDLRYAVRVLVASPTYTLVSLLTLALAIGATTAIFTVVNSVILRPLPFPEPDRLVTVWAANANYNLPGRPPGAIAFSPGDFLDLRDQNHSFAQIGGFAFDTYTLTGRSEPDRITGGLISAGFVSALGIQPAAGRLFVKSDDSPNADRVAILSHSLWMERFGGSATAIGSTLRLDDHDHMIVGVMPAGFRPFNQDVDVWLPLERKIAPESMRWRYSYYMRVLARLKPGVSRDQARQDVDRILEGIRKQFPGDINTGGVVVPLLDNTVAPARKPLLLFLGAVGFVLLIACANVANLSLARANTRRREIALRVALGANRGRIVRQLFTEALLLAAAGAALGLILAEWGVRGLLKLAPDEIPRAAEIHVDGWVLVFTILAATASALIFGLWPAFAASKSDQQQDLRGVRQRARSILVVCEIALALILMIGAGLMIESFRRVSHVDPGFDPRGLITMRVALSESHYDTLEKQNDFYRRLIDRLRALPELKAASAIDGLPFTDGGFDNSFNIDGRSAPEGHPFQADIRRVDSGYLSALNIPIETGRALTDLDRANTPSVVVISASMQRKYWPNESAIGKHLAILFGPPGGIHAEIVGVAADVRSALDATPRDLIYMPYSQGRHVAQMDLVLRPHQAATNAASLARSVRALVAALDPDQPVYRVHAMAELLSLSLATRNFEMLVLAIFAGFAVCLAVVGLYGVLAYSVQARTKEIGIRTALGANQQQVSAIVLRYALRLTAIGLAAGVIGALVLTRLLLNLLYGIRPIDPPTFIAVSLLLLIVAIIAGYIPARRAARIDPLVALRHD